MSDFDARFGGLARLFGTQGLQRLRVGQAMVVGVGGVGSWAAEALARSGIGTLMLVDLDDVCLSNVNRQLHALTGTVGLSKVEVMAERLRAIHPEGTIIGISDFFTAETASRVLSYITLPQHSWVVDAIDAVSNKCLLIAECRRRGIPLITCGAAGGKLDPTLIRVADLVQVTHDRLLSEVRRRLRRDFEFPRSDRRWGIPAVFSSEAPKLPQPDGTSCAAAAIRGSPGDSRRLNCDHGFGSAAFVTGAFGFAAAAHVTRCLAEESDHQLTNGDSQPPGAPSEANRGV